MISVSTTFYLPRLKNFKFLCHKKFQLIVLINPITLSYKIYDKIYNLHEPKVQYTQIISVFEDYFRFRPMPDHLYPINTCFIILSNTNNLCMLFKIQSTLLSSITLISVLSLHVHMKMLEHNS